jgi:uncharacterized Zn finger protein (UPF0148 family)
MSWTARNPKRCDRCWGPFLPSGGNARYCPECRAKVVTRHAPTDSHPEGAKYDPERRRRHYERMKANPEAYAKHLEWSRESQRRRRQVPTEGEIA